MVPSFSCSASGNQSHRAASPVGAVQELVHQQCTDSLALWGVASYRALRAPSRASLSLKSDEMNISVFFITCDAVWWCLMFRKAVVLECEVLLPVFFCRWHSLCSLSPAVVWHRPMGRCWADAGAAGWEFWETDSSTARLGRAGFCLLRRWRCCLALQLVRCGRVHSFQGKSLLASLWDFLRLF